MTGTSLAAMRGLLSTFGVVALVAAAVTASTGAADGRTAVLVGGAGMVLLAVAAFAPSGRPVRPAVTYGASAGSVGARTSLAPAATTTASGRGRRSTVGDVVDTVAADGSTVSRGTLRVYAFDPTRAGDLPGTSWYTTLRHGRGTRFGFALVRLTTSGELRAYIAEQPSYGRRSSGAHPTHRLTDRHGRRYVCWTDPVTEVPQILWVAREWAERTMRYIETGTPFEQPDPSADSG